MRWNQNRRRRATSLAGLYAIGKLVAPDCTRDRLGEQFAAGRLVVATSRVPSDAAGATSIALNAADSLPEWQSGDVQNVDELVVIYHNWDEIRRLCGIMWESCARQAVQRASARLRNLQREIREFYWTSKSRWTF